MLRKTPAVNVNRQPGRRLRPTLDIRRPHPRDVPWGRSTAWSPSAARRHSRHITTRTDRKGQAGKSEFDRRGEMGSFVKSCWTSWLPPPRSDHRPWTTESMKNVGTAVNVDNVVNGSLMSRCNISSIKHLRQISPKSPGKS